MIIRHNATLKQLAEQLPFEPNLPWDELEPDIRNQILHGTGERLFSFKLKGGNSKPDLKQFEGVLADLENIRRTTSSDSLRARLMAYQTRSLCESCQGHRLHKTSLSVLINGKSITDLLRCHYSQLRPL